MNILRPGSAWFWFRSRRQFRPFCHPDCIEAPIDSRAANAAALSTSSGHHQGSPKGLDPRHYQGDSKDPIQDTVKEAGKDPVPDTVKEVRADPTLAETVLQPGPGPLPAPARQCHL